MNLQSILQEATPIANILNVLVIAVGYFFLIKLYREWIGQSRESRTAGGRPQVVVSVDYSHLPEVNIVVHNFTDAPAKDVSFEFSAPVEDPDGLVISDLPYLERGLPFLEPGGRIGRPWGRLPDLAPMLKEKGLEGGIRVTTRYKDLAEESYETEWTLDPLLFEGSGIQNSLGMNDLVAAVKEIPGGRSAAGGNNGQHRGAASHSQ
jgi:hypothetical protein